MVWTKRPVIRHDHLALHQQVGGRAVLVIQTNHRNLQPIPHILHLWAPGESPKTLSADQRGGHR